MRLVYLYLLVVLAGCSGNLQQLKEKNPQAGSFSGALAAEYLAYAQSEAEEGRIDIADHLASKGLQALSGEAVLPDTIPENVPEETRESMAIAREAVLSVLTEDMKRVTSQKIARAQLLFDCWVQQSKHSNLPFTPCADEFQSSIGELSQIAESFIYGEETEHTLHFAGKNAGLGSKAGKMVDEVAKRLSCVAKYTVELRGHEYGKDPSPLTVNRMQSIRDTLVKKGIPEDRIVVINDDDAQAVYLSTDAGDHGVNDIDVTVRTFGLWGTALMEREQ